MDGGGERLHLAAQSLSLGSNVVEALAAELDLFIEWPDRVLGRDCWRAAEEEG